MPDTSGGRYTQSDSAGAEQVRCGRGLGVLDGVQIGAT